MKNFIQNIRKKPKEVRNNYAYGFSAVFTLIVASFWFMNFSAFDANEVAVKEDEEKQTPFATLIRTSKEQLASIKDAFTKNPQKSESTDETVESASSTESNKIILTEDDLKVIKDKATENNSASTDVDLGSTTTAKAATTTSTDVYSTTSKPVYNEVMIGTTTATSSDGL